MLKGTNRKPLRGKRKRREEGEVREAGEEKEREGGRSEGNPRSLVCVRAHAHARTHAPSGPMASPCASSDEDSSTAGWLGRISIARAETIVQRRVKQSYHAPTVHRPTINK